MASLRLLNRAQVFFIFLGFIFCLPFLFPGFFLELMHFPPGLKELPWLLFLVVVYFCGKDFESSGAALKPERNYWLYFCFALALLTCFYHGIFVDEGSLFEGLTNREVQMKLHQDILNHNPGALPHSYRFLPDSLVALINFWMNDFRSATSLYRLSFQFLVFYFLLKLSFQYVAKPSSALLVMMFYALVYPISVRNYAGQMTDPMSHLSFILALYFANKRDLKWFVLIMVFGVLAKESVIVMAPIYWFLNQEEKSVKVKVVVLGGSLLALLALVRIFVLQGVPAGTDISGVGADHWFNNFWGNKAAWVPGFSYFILIWLPLAFKGKFDQKKSLGIIFAYLMVAIFVSSTLFSWIREYRNFVPAIFVLGLMMALRWEKVQKL